MSKTKIGDMGTTGLVDYVKSHPSGRLKSLAKGRVIRILKIRGYNEKAIEAFKKSIYKTEIGS